MADLLLPGAEPVAEPDGVTEAVRAAASAVGGRFYRIDPAFSDTAEFAARYDVPLARCANTIVTRTGRGENARFALCLVPADRRLDTNSVKVLLGGGKTSFAKPEEARDITGMAFGAITVLGITTQLPIFLAREFPAGEKVVLGAGVREMKIVVNPARLHGTVADITVS